MLICDEQIFLDYLIYKRKAMERIIKAMEDFIKFMEAQDVNKRIPLKDSLEVNGFDSNGNPIKQSISDTTDASDD